MQIANIKSRLCLVSPDGAVDIADASDGRFGPDIADVYDQWDDLVAWVAGGVDETPKPYEPTDVGPPSPRPRQSFALAANYADHIAEAGMTAPEKPAIFTKFPSCITGPTDDIILPSNRADWEVELVVVIGRTAHHVSEADAWDHIAGFTIGQDISERRVQFQKPIIQLAMGKSFPTFGPIGPNLVTLDELDDPTDLAISCTINGEQVQSSRTSQFVFDIPTMIAYLSRHLTLLPGDVIFTGTPAGVGSTRDPRRYLVPGDEIISEIEGLGRMHQRCVDGSPTTAE